MAMRHVRSYIWLCLFFCAFSVAAQNMSIKGNLVKEISIGANIFTGIPRDMCSDSNGVIWIGANEGLYFFDGFNFKFFNHQLFKNTYLKEVIHVQPFIKNTLIMKLGEDGILLKYESNTGKGEDINLKPNQVPVGKNNEFHIVHKSRYQCWIGYKQLGLAYIDSQFNVKIIANSNTVKGMGDRVKWISDGPDGTLVLNTDKGLLLYNIRNNTVEPLIQNVYFNGANIYNNSGFVLAADKSNLNIFDIQKKERSIQNFDIDHFTIFSFANDRNGNSYFSFLSQLYRIDKHKGLQKIAWKNNFYNNQILYLHVDAFDNLWIIASKSGVQQYKLDQSAPIPKLQSFQLSAIDVNNTYLFPKSIKNYTIDLKEYENNVKVYVGMCNTFNPNIEFRYRLVGYSNKWVQSKLSYVEFNHLPAGNYVFEAAARSAKGEWINANNTFNIRINEPWFKKWYFILPLILFISFLSILIYRYFRVRKQQMEMKKEIEIESRAIVESDKIKTQFFDNITHELKTPLTLIQLPLEDLLNKSRSEPDKKLLLRIKNNSLRLQKMINQILEFSRTQNLTELETDDVFCLQDLRQELIQPMAELAKSENLQFQYDLENETQTFKSNYQLTFSIIENLLSNAIKYNKEKGSVELHLGLKDENLTARVSDTGIGISKEEQTRIFDRFYLIGKKQNPLNGTGIGLSIVKEAIEKLNGNIVVDSIPNVGTTFTIHLPVKIIAPSNSVHTDDLPSLLIVEDNLELCEYLDQHLQEHFKIIFAHNGKEGLISAQENMPHIIVTDIMMPIMDGFQMIEKLKTNEITSHIPIFILSAKSSDSSREIGFKLGVEDYLSKPYNKNELVQKLTKRVHSLGAVWKDIISETEIDAIHPTIQVPISGEKKLLEKLRTIVLENIEDPQFDPLKFGKQAGMSRTQLHNKLKTVAGQSTTEFINSVRINKASELLNNSDYTISEICDLVGYNSLSYFSRKFSEIAGCSPQEYRKKIKQNLV